MIALLFRVLFYFLPWAIINIWILDCQHRNLHKLKKKFMSPNLRWILLDSNFILFSPPLALFFRLLFMKKLPVLLFKLVRSKRSTLIYWRPHSDMLFECISFVLLTYTLYIIYDIKNSVGCFIIQVYR